MKRLFKNHWSVISILLLAAILRFYALGSTPPSLMWDEAALGYNAYSLSQTARDEYGNFLPLILKSFGDFKPGLYAYLTIPSVVIFGLTEFAVRFPSALLGTLTILLVFLMIKELVKNLPFTYHLSLITSFVLAISPWHIEFSRGAWEANLAVFLIVTGVLFFLKSFRNSKFLPLSAIFFGLTFLAYQGAKVFTPLFLIGLLIFYHKDIRKIPVRVLLTSLFCLAILAVPIFWSATGEAGGRAKVMSVFSYPRPQANIQEILNQDQTNKSSLVFVLFHNEPLNFARGILGRYFNHFSGRFLFFEGDWSNKRLGVPYMGVMYFIEIIFLAFGIYFLVRQKNMPGRNLLFYWLLISPLPAAITRDSISAVRALNMVIPLSIIVAAGIYQIIVWLKTYSKMIQFMVYGLWFMVYGWNFVYFFDQYFLHAPIHNSATSQYGYREVVNFVAPIAKNYDKIAFTQKYGQSYIYWLFYTKYDPGNYQRQAHLIESQSGDVGQVTQIDNIEFRNFHWPLDVNIASLFIGNDLDLPMRFIEQTNGARLLKEIYFSNGQLAFRIVEKK